jgi:hypothetical protein
MLFSVAALGIALTTELMGKLLLIKSLHKKDTIFHVNALRKFSCVGNLLF